MKIIHYHHDMLLETGGVVRCVLDLCGGLAAAGHDVTVITVYDHDLPDAWRTAQPGMPRGVVIDPPTRPGQFFNKAALGRIAEMVREADVLHLHGMWTFYNLQLARLAKRLGVPYVYSVHGMLDDWCMAQGSAKKRLFLALGGKAMLRNAAAVHTTATAELSQARRWFGGDRGVVVPLMLDLDPFADLPGRGAAAVKFPRVGTAREAQQPVLLFLSRLHHKKGVEHVIDAAAELRGRGLEPLTVIAGTGDDDYQQMLEHRASELGISDAVLFPGFVSGRDKVALYQAADVFVLPTNQENFGFVVFEALAAETPVVTTRGVDTWPELEASGGAVIVDQGAKAVADGVHRVLQAPQQGAAMGEAGRRWVMGNLSAEAVLGRFEAMYRAAMAE